MNADKKLRWEGRLFGPKGMVRTLLQSPADIVMMALIGLGVLTAYAILGLGIAGLI